MKNLLLCENYDSFYVSIIYSMEDFRRWDSLLDVGHVRQKKLKILLTLKYETALTNTTRDVVVK